MPFCETAPARGRQAASHALKPDGRDIAAGNRRTHGRPSYWLGALVAAVLGFSNQAEAADLRGLVDQAAAAAGVPGRLAHAVVSLESGYNPALRGAAGEWGIGQIKCATARSVGFAGPCARLADAATNLRFAFAYLRLALDRGGAGCAGVSLYQRGLGGRLGCTAYGRQVMARVR